MIVAIGITAGFFAQWTLRSWFEDINPQLMSLGATNIPGRVSASDPKRAELAAKAVLPELKPELEKKGFRVGDPIFIRIFKQERELELWVYHRADRRYRLFKTYAVAEMSGALGPKEKEGDRQAPEGFYFVPPRAMNPLSNFHLSFNLGYPNEFDQAHGRTGSALMVHGNAVSIGCFAMTDHRVEEIYTLADAALDGGQKFFRVHCFPFRMTEEAMEKHRSSKWFSFWQNLRDGYLRFERSGLPPEVNVRDKRYIFADGKRPL